MQTASLVQSGHGERNSAPWQTPYVESFGGRLRVELLAVEAFNSLLEAQVLVEDWRIQYNTLRPHSALGYLTPTDYAKTWTTHHPHSHSGWTNNRGPVKGMTTCSARWSAP